MPRLQLNIAALTLFLILQLPVLKLFAQDRKEATIKLSFSQTDSTKTCKATVMSVDSSLPVKEMDVHLYVKRLYALLPIGKAVATDENGVAEIDFPVDLPGDKNNILLVIAKIENDDTYRNTDAQATIKWGVLPKTGFSELSSRSLSASREHAPTFLVVASSLVIVLIWGTIFYIIFQLFKIKKSARVIKNLTVAEK